MPTSSPLEHPTSAGSLTIRALRARPVNVPMRRPLATGGGTVSAVPLVLIDLQTEEGITGSSYVFCYMQPALLPVARLVLELDAYLRGDALAPYAIERKLQQRFRLVGPQGFTGFALAGIEMAAWDALAKSVGLPLARLLGGEIRSVPAYNSCGLGIIGEERVGPEAQELAEGYGAIKVRLGYPTLAMDQAVVRAVRGAVGDGVLLMSDYNQCLTVPEAIHRARHLDEQGLYWIEEPTTADDYAGHAAISREARTPVQLGENWWGPHDMSKSLSAGASDFGMADVVKIGGVSGWLRAAALAEAHALPLSSHLYPEICSHLLAVTPTAHWLEYVDWAGPILVEPFVIRDGHSTASDKPGIGLVWDEGAVSRFLVS